MTDRITIRIEQDVAAALDRFIADGAVPVRSKQDVFRHIVRQWLADQGYLPLQRTQEAASQPDAR